ncbi:MAG: hypothetical protein M1830_000119 [Pleopsidium flavum]|nr:MAG: hypothetical protein M1830_000119 [Pleopsidium flavum]
MSRLWNSVMLFVVLFSATFFHSAVAFPTISRRQENLDYDISKYTVPLSDGKSPFHMFHLLHLHSQPAPASPAPFLPFTKSPISKHRHLSSCFSHLQYSHLPTSPSPQPSISFSHNLSLTHQTKLTPHLTTGTVSLPPPSPHLSLKAITLARGVQNYTCPSLPPTPPTSAPTTTTSPCTTTTPTPIGALATLYDASPLLCYLSTRSPGHEQSILNLLPTYLAIFPFPNILPSSSSNKNKNKNSKSTTDNNGHVDADNPSNPHLPVLGTHYFDALSIPTFDLRPQVGFFKGRKTGDIPAPVAGAVDWLKLESGEGSQGIGEVYRVVTAGGKAPGSCEGLAGRGVEVEYAAQYWFYG